MYLSDQLTDLWTQILITYIFTSTVVNTKFENTFVKFGFSVPHTFLKKFSEHSSPYNGVQSQAVCSNLCQIKPEASFLLCRLKMSPVSGLPFIQQQLSINKKENLLSRQSVRSYVTASHFSPVCWTFTSCDGTAFCVQISVNKRTKTFTQWWGRMEGHHWWVDYDDSRRNKRKGGNDISD